MPQPTSERAYFLQSADSVRKPVPVGSGLFPGHVSGRLMTCFAERSALARSSQPKMTWSGWEDKFVRISRMDMMNGMRDLLCGEPPSPFGLKEGTGWSLFLIDDFEAFAQEGHILGGLFADAGEGSGEELPVDSSPVFEGAVPFAFVVGELGIDLVVGCWYHLDGFDDAAGDA